MNYSLQTKKMFVNNLVFMLFSIMVCIFRGTKMNNRNRPIGTQEFTKLLYRQFHQITGSDLTPTRSNTVLIDVIRNLQTKQGLWIDMFALHFTLQYWLHYPWNPGFVLSQSTL